MANTISEVVERDLCIGCGACAGICPRNHLTMHMGGDGAYAPCLQGACPANCGVCLRVCPFAVDQVSETQLAEKVFPPEAQLDRHAVLGYCGPAWVGHVAEGAFRAQGASGGLATWLLHELLATGRVDAVACVRPTATPDQLYTYQLCRTSADILTGSRSAYYPVELSSVIQSIRQQEGRVAIIGLPCVCKAVRLLMQVDRRLTARIPYLLGLVCGHTVTRAFTEYLADTHGLNHRTLRCWQSRGKDPAQPASNYYYQGADDTRECRISFLPDVAQLWSAKAFTPRPCLLCDDVFAETADLVLMDAWLAPYTQDWRGANIAVSRHAELTAIIEQGRAQQRLELQPLDLTRVEASQAGVVREKRQLLAHRLWVEQQAGRVIPTKRVTPAPPDRQMRAQITDQLAVARTSLALARESGMTSDVVAQLRTLVTAYARTHLRKSLFSRLCAKLRLLVATSLRRGHS